MRSNGRPQVTVLMPVYNGEAHLRETIRSIQRQTFKNFEFIIINDGSTDRTLDLLRGYARRDKRIRVLFNHPNQGIVRSLNKGLRAARASTIARIDCGDVCSPRRLEAQYAYFQKHPQCVLLGTQVNRVDEMGKIVGWTSHPEDDRGIRESLFCGKSVIAHPSAMYRKIKGLAYRENAYPAEDYDYWLRILEHGKAAILHERLVDLTNDPASISHKHMAKQAIIVRRLQNLLVERIKYGREKSPLPDLRQTNRWRWKAATSLYCYKIQNHYYRFHPMNLLLNLAMALLCPTTLIAKTSLSMWPKYFHREEFQSFCSIGGK